MSFEQKLSSRWNTLLSLFFGLMVFIQFGYLLVGFASIPVYYQRVATQTIAPSGLYGQVTMSSEIIAEEAAERGLSLRGYAAYRVVVNTLAALIPTAVALVIIWHRRQHWFAWFTALVILFLGNSYLFEQIIVGRLISQELLGANAIFWFFVLLLFFLFPNGQVVPRRLGRVIIGLVIYHFFIQVGTVLAYVTPEFAAAAGLPNWGSSVFVTPVLLNFLLILAAQVYRYRRVSTPTERQQTKWFLAGFGLTVLTIPFSILSGGQGGFVDDITSVTLFTPLPLALFFAILRYGLWDIDIIIRRTLVYGSITALSALVFLGTVTVTQNLFTAATGQTSPLSVVLSTLVIAALFSPLRRRIQAFIDRRFYRQKYNAEQALAAFAALSARETNLAHLSHALLNLARDTVQPELVSLWLKPIPSRPEVPR
jgi:hypothetical protein